jgi:hypothetical protein
MNTNDIEIPERMLSRRTPARERWSVGSFGCSSSDAPLVVPYGFAEMLSDGPFDLFVLRDQPHHHEKRHHSGDEVCVRHFPCTTTTGHDRYSL